MNELRNIERTTAYWYRMAIEFDWYNFCDIYLLYYQYDLKNPRISRASLLDYFRELRKGQAYQTHNRGFYVLSLKG